MSDATIKSPHTLNSQTCDANIETMNPGLCPTDKGCSVLAICCQQAHTCRVPPAKRHKFLWGKFVTSDVDLGTSDSSNRPAVNQEHVAHIRNLELKTSRETTWKTYADKGISGVCRFRLDSNGSPQVLTQFF